MPTLKSKEPCYEDGNLRAVAAAIAVGHAIVVGAFHVFSRHEPYHGLGANCFDGQRRDHLVDHVTRRIQLLVYHVQLEPVQTA